MGRFTALVVEQTPCQVSKSGKTGQNWKKVPLKGNLLTFKGGIFFLCGLIAGFLRLGLSLRNSLETFFYFRVDITYQHIRI
jgi:hypothetical protein